MNIELFNKKYWARRFGEQIEYKGYLISDHKDFVVSLNIHPMGADQINMLPEGERMIKHLEGHGSCILKTSNIDTGAKGDLLFYNGEWYECVLAQHFDHTLLDHFNYQFKLVPKDAAGTVDTSDPPTLNPNSREEVKTNEG